MQRKLSKHFIYNWLREDAFGEIVLKSSSRLAHIISQKIWDQKNIRKLINKFNPLARIRLSRAIEFSLLNLKQAQFNPLPYFLRTSSTIMINVGPLPLFSENIDQVKLKLIHALLGGRSLFDPKSINWSPTLRRRINLSFTSIPRKIQVLNHMHNTSPSNSDIRGASNRWSFVAQLWDTFMFRLKGPIKRFERGNLPLSSSVRSTTSSAHKIRWRYTSSTKVPTKVVKKNEIREVLRFRLLSYLGFVNNQRELKAYHHIIQPYLNSFHLSVVALLLRSGFFENGYIVNSLIKRTPEGLTRNGSVISSNTICKPWDILSVTKHLWWLVYARFYNFFSNLGAEQALGYYPRGLLKRLLRVRKLFKRSPQTPALKSSLASSRNLILPAATRYMEVSYKLFMLIVLDSVAVREDLFVNLRALKRVNLLK